MGDLIQTTVYEDNSGVSRYLGVTLEPDSLRQYLPSRVKARYDDLAGTLALVDKFKDIVTTDFQNERLIEIFTLETDPIDWKIGESIAECYLEDKCKVVFPHNTIRDARNPKSSQAGADIVGLDCSDENEVIFIFGEVKTSADKDSPPNVLYGRSGMIQQLEIIKDNLNNRDILVRWLASKVLALPDGDALVVQFKKALKTFVENNKKVKIVGVLVRDTEPLESDLQNRFTELCKTLDGSMSVNLMGLYLPFPITDLPSLLIIDNA